MFKQIKDIFSKSPVVEINNRNINCCFYCGNELINTRISIKNGKYFHQSCIKKWYRNNKRSLING